MGTSVSPWLEDREDLAEELEEARDKAEAAEARAVAVEAAAAVAAAGAKAKVAAQRGEEQAAVLTALGMVRPSTPFTIHYCSPCIGTLCAVSHATINDVAVHCAVRTLILIPILDPIPNPKP